jgi:replicative DNA helicase
MSQVQVGVRLLAAHSKLSASKIRTPRWIQPEGWAELWNAAGEMAEWPVWVDDASELRLSELIARARLYIRKHKAQLIVIDYLMLIDAPGKELRHQADAISKAMRALAKTENVSVILLSQFKRGQNINDRPNMSWFKESGGIEANAHVALALHREIGEDDRFSGKDEIIVVKNREGELGTCPVYYDPKRLQFFDAVREGMAGQ